MIVNPFYVGELAVDRLRPPTAEKNWPSHGLVVVLRRVVREQQTPPDVLGILPVAAGPAHEHEARRANLLAGMKQQMSSLHSAHHGDAFPIPGVSEIGFPTASPSNGADDSVIAGLQVKEGQSIPAGRVPAGRRFEVVDSSRTEMFLQRFEVFCAGVAAPGMADETVTGRSREGPVQGQDVLDNGRV